MINNDAIERDFRTQAREWRKLKGNRPVMTTGLRSAAVSTAAWYLHKHQELFQVEDTQERKDKHEQWMKKLVAWFDEETATMARW